MSDLPYQRILLKLSGEILAGENGTGIDPSVVSYFAREIKSVVDQGLEVCLVIGGGNIFRGGANTRKIERVTGDYMGMLGTVINALAIQDALEKSGIPTRVQTAISITQVAEPFIRRRAMRHLEKGRVLIFAAGTGNPFFTTDSAAALRAAEMNVDALLKGTKVDGVYDKDPVTHTNAVRYTSLSYEEAIERNLKVMDLSAIALCRENKIPIIVFNFKEPGHLLRVIKGEPIGTILGG
ncbi:MAG: Uridylate kinase [Marinimicrobia bacterium 46_47]|nr:MAG: Uridylate kinase [Marinimicrobia bacterium 46_47]KUK89839.1 MAG: Uridylate kinase [Marinimicrobia bacterium 46_43]HBY17835.1 UMP kinase [Candidatus Neomarinimicrobiota bacterium]